MTKESPNLIYIRLHTCGPPPTRKRLTEAISDHFLPGVPTIRPEAEASAGKRRWDRFPSIRMIKTKDGAYIRIIMRTTIGWLKVLMFGRSLSREGLRLTLTETLISPCQQMWEDTAVGSD